MSLRAHSACRAAGLPPLGSPPREAVGPLCAIPRYPLAGVARRRGRDLARLPLRLFPSTRPPGLALSFVAQCGIHPSGAALPLAGGMAGRELPRVGVTGGAVRPQLQAASGSGPPRAWPGRPPSASHGCRATLRCRRRRAACWVSQSCGRLLVSRPRGCSLSGPAALPLRAAARPRGALSAHERSNLATARQPFHAGDPVRVAGGGRAGALVKHV